MLNKIYQEIVTIRKELQAIRNGLGIETEAERCAKNACTSATAASATIIRSESTCASSSTGNAKISETYG